MAGRPVGVVLGDQRGEVAAPDFNELAVGFKVKLDAVDGAPDPKCLDIGTVAVREMHGVGRQHERVGMPVKNGTSIAERGDERIAPSRLARSHLLPAELDRPAENIPGAMAAGDELGAETDAEHRLVGLAELPGEGGQRRQVGVVVIVDGALPAAEDDDAVVPGMIFRDRLAEMSLAEVDLGARLAERLADDAGGRSDEILDDEHAHEGFRIAFARRKPCRLGSMAPRPGRAAARESVMRLGQARTPGDMRLYAIGDIHGCDDLLAGAHAKIADDLARRPVADYRVIHCGDYVDRGPDSAGVVERLIRLKVDDSRAIFLRGNHEEFLLAFLRAPERVGEVWLINGAAETLASYGVFVGDYADLTSLGEAFAARLPRNHRGFLEDMTLSVSFGDFFFCHAGVRPGVALDRQKADDLIWIREGFLDSGADFGKVVIHGHTPVPEPEVLPNRIDIDTGAVFSGRLTCLALEGSSYRFL